MKDMIERFKLKITRKRIKKAINSLIKSNKELRDSYFARMSKVHSSPFIYAIDFCTIHINPGRGSGKSTFIELNAGGNDLVIAGSRFNFRGKNRIKSGAWTICPEATSLDTFAKFLRGRRLDNVYIDEPALVLKTWDIHLNDLVYRILRNDHNFADRGGTFILLGK